MREQLRFRITSFPKLEFEANLEKVKLGSFDDNYVKGVLGRSDYETLNSAQSRPTITDSQLINIRRKVLEIRSSAQKAATQNGGVSEAKARAIFDQGIYQAAMEIFPLTRYEAANSQIWEYLTIRLLLDVAYWRFGETNYHDRYLGLNRARHVFARWWFRRDISDQSEVESHVVLKETEWENIFERQSLCWNPEIANACLRVLTDTRSLESRVRGTLTDLESADRVWIKRILRLTSQRTLDGFYEDELYEMFSELYPS